MPTRTVLCVDPDGAARSETAAALSALPGLAVEEADGLAGATDALAGVDCVVSEYDLPDGSGLDLFARARESVPDATLVLFTAADLSEIDTAASGEAVAEYVPKDGPDARERLASLVEHGVATGTQTAYPLPDDEEERLDALSAYALDTAALDEAIDRLTDLARAALGVPMAGVGVVAAHEQRFLACRGVDLDRVPREETVCTYAMLEREVTVVEDLQADPRFEANDDLRELGIRAYASANLTTPEGRVLGTFCVYDREPRSFDDRERALLETLAAEATDQLELRRRLHDEGVSADV